MIYYMSPYSLNKNLGEAYNQCMELIQDDDWICFTDGDVLFLTHDFGTQISNIINKYPDAGILTCFTNRVGNRQQQFNGEISDVSDIGYWRKIAKALNQNKYDHVRELNKFISGHLMIIKKKTWAEMGKFPDGLLAVDNKFSKRILDAGKKILLMEGMLVFHYYRLLEGGKSYKAHLL